jgi:hypothetical protein
MFGKAAAAALVETHHRPSILTKCHPSLQELSAFVSTALDDIPAELLHPRNTKAIEGDEYDHRVLAVKLQDIFYRHP